jgi:predicted RNA-binding Zn-ribbon protein involved in translation (DUF1610 family)
MTLHDPDSDKYIAEDEIDDLTSAVEACPNCGEREVDRFDRIDDDHVKCTSCGQVFSLTP